MYVYIYKYLHVDLRLFRYIGGPFPVCMSGARKAFRTRHTVREAQKEAPSVRGPGISYGMSYGMSYEIWDLLWDVLWDSPDSL